MYPGCAVTVCHFKNPDDFILRFRTFRDMRALLAALLAIGVNTRHGNIIMPGANMAKRMRNAKSNAARLIEVDRARQNHYHAHLFIP